MLFSRWISNVREFSDAASTIHDLKKRGKAVAVATLTSHGYIGAYKAKFETFSSLDAIVAPEMALKAAELLGFRP